MTIVQEMPHAGTLTTGHFVICLHPSSKLEG